MWNIIDKLGSICSIISAVSLFNIAMILKRKFRAEIYRDDTKKIIQIYISGLNTDKSQFAKTKELKDSEVFQKKCLLYYFEDRKIKDEGFGGERKGQFQTQYISFYKCLVEQAVKRYITKPEYKEYRKEKCYLSPFQLRE